MNVEKIKGDKYINKYEGFWRSNEKSKDFIGNSYPIPKHKKSYYDGQYLFAKKLKKLQESLDNQVNFKSIKSLDCKLCDAKNIGNKEYNLKRVHWRDDLLHYIIHHNYKPSAEFMEFILGHYVGVLSNNNIRLPTLTYQKREQKDSKKKYVKIDKNQLQILDALMKNGGITKKYEDDKGDFKYSEHAGLLIFNTNILDKFIVASNSTRNVKEDPEIFLPTNLIEAYDCEYIFHTHPPTPDVGSRIKYGVLYEFPSSSDIAHFIEHSNLGLTKGSLVITPEGLYNIRLRNSGKKVFFSDDNKSELSKAKFLEHARNLEKKIQKEYITKWITDKSPFSIDKFYSEIAQDTSFINELNDFLKKYNVKVDYYPRVKNKKGEYILDDVYLPL